MLPYHPPHSTPPTRWPRGAVPLAAALVCLAISACRGAMPTGSVQRAGVLVLHGDGTMRQACVEFTEPSISGYELLTRSGLASIVDPRNAMGVLVCSIDGEGCSFPEQDCLCACQAGGGCTYWAYFTRASDASWTYSPVGPSMRRVSDGDVDAWVWLTSPGAQASQSPPLPSLDLDDICGPLSAATESR